MIPANAPTTGTAAVIFWSCAGAFLILGLSFGLIKFFRLSAVERQKYKARDENQSLAILKSQIEDMKRVQAEQSEKIADLEKDREFDREERHALSDRVQGVLAYGEVYYQTLHEIKAAWPEMPTFFINRIEGMKKPGEILERYPLPKRE